MSKSSQVTSLLTLLIIILGIAALVYVVSGDSDSENVENSEEEYFVLKSEGNAYALISVPFKGSKIVYREDNLIHENRIKDEYAEIEESVIVTENGELITVSGKGAIIVDDTYIVQNRVIRLD
jgi:hypothetical protein